MAFLMRADRALGMLSRLLLSYGLETESGEWTLQSFLSNIGS
jgi:hypothetical protein